MFHLSSLYKVLHLRVRLKCVIDAKKRGQVMQDSLVPHGQNGRFFPSSFHWPGLEEQLTQPLAAGFWSLPFVISPPPRCSPFSRSCACGGLHPVLLLIAFLKNVFFPLFSKILFSFLLQYSCTHCGTDVFTCDAKREKKMPLFHQW